MTLWAWFATQQALTVGIWYLATGFVVSIVLTVIFEIVKIRDRRLAREIDARREDNLKDEPLDVPAF